MKLAIAQYIAKKAKQMLTLQKRQDELSRRKNHEGMIYVGNTVALEGPPPDFYYLNEHKAAHGIGLASEVTFSCSHTHCFFEKHCSPEADAILVYDKNQHIKIPPHTPTNECDSRCHCGPDCPHRVVQKGTPHPLCIF